MSLFKAIDVKLEFNKLTRSFKYNVLLKSFRKYTTLTSLPKEIALFLKSSVIHSFCS